MPPEIERFWAKVIKYGPTDCWLWIAQLDNQGYGCFRANNPRRMIYAHRYSWELANGFIPAGMCVLHICDTPRCVNPNHLTLGTLADNSRDCAAKQRGNTVKLNAAQIQTLREAIHGHQTYGLTKYYSEKFGVHRSTIRRAAKKIAFKLL